MPWSAPGFSGGITWQDLPSHATPLNAADLNTEESAEATYAAACGASVASYFEGGSSPSVETTVSRASGGDDTTTIQTALTAGVAGGKVKLATGQTYNVSSSLSLPTVSDFVFDLNGSTIKATAAITSAGVIDSPVGSQLNRPTIRNGVIDCNNNADDGLFVRFFKTCTVEDVTVLKFNANGFVFGDPAAASTSYEAKCRGIATNRGNADAVPAGSFGIWMRYATDSEILQAGTVGADAGIRNDQGDNSFVQCHAWGYSGHVPTVCFDDNNDGEWIRCVADTPSTYGFRLRQQNSRILGGKTYVNSAYGVTNTVVAVQVDTGSAVFSVIGHRFQGSDASHTLAADYGGSGAPSANANATSVGNQRTNVVTSNSDQLASGIRGLTAFGGNPGSAQQKFALPTSFSGAAGLANGTNLQGYAGNFSGQTLNIDPSTGALQPGNKAGGTAALGPHIYGGSGAPTKPGNVDPTAGDYYFRTDTPSTANQRVYICTTGGASPVWSGIV